MKTTINIKNFRVFDENGATFELNPITILTGSNSSGKSSINKAIMLLKTYIDHIIEDIRKGNKPNLSAYKLDFASTAGTLKLGSFHQALHRGSQNELITFEITTYSRLLGEDIVVTLAFESDKNDVQDNGYLCLIEFKDRTVKLFIVVKSMNLARHISFNPSVTPTCLKIVFFKFFNTIIWWGIQNEHFCYHGDSNFYEEFAELWGWDSYCIGHAMCKDIYKEKRITYKQLVNEYSRNYLNNVKAFCYSNENILYDSNDGYALGSANPYLSEAHEALNHNFSVFENAFQYKTLFFIPIFNEIWNMDKAKVRSFLMDKAKKTHYSGVSSILDDYTDHFNIIMDDFENSDHTNFGDYFKQKEREFLSKGSPHHYIALPQDSFDNYVSRRPLNNEEISRIIQDSDDIEWEKHHLCWLLYIIEILNPVYSKHQEFSLSWLYECLGLFSRFVEWTFEDIMTMMLPNEISYFSPNSASVKRLYTEGEFFTTLSAYLDTKRRFLYLLSDDYHHPQEAGYIPIESGFKPGDFINEWLKKLDVADELLITQVEDGLGLKVATLNKKNNEKTLLADQGVGVTQLIALLLRIETLILDNILHHSKIWESNGKEVIHYDENLIILEEPEMHLHPKYQSLLADMFLEAYEKYNIHFIVETHSEYLIRKTQVLVARNKYENEEDMNENNPFKIYYVPNDEKPYEMKFRLDGKFSNEFGTGFFDESSNLLFEIL